MSVSKQKTWFCIYYSRLVVWKHVSLLKDRASAFMALAIPKNKIKRTVVTLHAHAHTQTGMQRFIVVNPGRPHA